MNNNFEVSSRRKKNRLGKELIVPSRTNFFSNYSLPPHKVDPKYQINIINKKLDELTQTNLQGKINNLKNPYFAKRLFGALQKSDEVKRDEKYIELSSIAVKNDFKRKGIGKLLINYLINSVDLEEYKYINLETDAISNEIVNNENKDEVDAETPQTENKKYIGVPNPNDFYYSFHNGKIDDAYTTLEGCYNKSIEVNFLDTVDIINSTCYEVLDENNTVLGIYMQVKCNSGNCEKYKKQVGINTN